MPTITVLAGEWLSIDRLRIGFETKASDDIGPGTPEQGDGNGAICFGNEQALHLRTDNFFDLPNGKVVIDWAFHAAGPATRWALGIEANQTLLIGEPLALEKSIEILETTGWRLLVGSHIAVAAIGKRFAELRTGLPVLIVARPEGETYSFPADDPPLQQCSDDTANHVAKIMALGRPCRNGEYIWSTTTREIADGLESDDVFRGSKWSVENAPYW